MGVTRTMEDKILTLHPKGKRGVNIDRSKYDAMKRTILDVLRAGELTHTELTAAVEARLTARFDGSIPWYMECTKLDLEARRTIERVEGRGHARYRVRRA